MLSHLDECRHFSSDLITNLLQKAREMIGAAIGSFLKKKNDFKISIIDYYESIVKISIIYQSNAC